MGPVVNEQLDDSRDHFNLGAMLLVALASVAGTTMLVWGLHFLHLTTASAAVGTPLPRIAVLPFHSLSASPSDIQADRKLTEAMIGGLTRITRVEALPADLDADPVLIGRETGVHIMLIGKVQRSGEQVKVTVQMVSARDGRQLWAEDFEGDSSNLDPLSVKIDQAVAPHLTALLD